MKIANKVVTVLLVSITIVFMVSERILAARGSGRVEPPQNQNSTYVPPDDIGGPDRSQGSGTR